ncbi:unnamed protein product [Peronospora farinosa]|nr:unnamed protein product [Peronospora farinosa]
MDVTEPMQVMAIAGTSGLVDVAGGNTFSLFLVENGTAYICGRDPSLNADKLLLSPSLLSLPSQLAHKFLGQIVSVSCGEMHYALLSKCGALLVSFGSFFQPSLVVGSTTDELQERRVAWVKEAGIVRQMTCGASHTIVVA